jgi:NADH-quinone oxidoreductase subunit A
MINGYALIAFFALGAFAFVGFIYFVSRLLQKQKPNLEKGSPYECGEEGFPTCKTSFQFRYYMAALLFLLFEVELVLMAPVFLSQQKVPLEWTSPDWLSLIRFESLLFVGILILGFALAIAGKYLDWERPDIQNPPFDGPVPDFAYEQFNLEQDRAQNPHSK